ncbi:vanadium-dependent haloperoxidase [Flaviaesturariibacter amylovorans]|uniref:Phosphatidic acid phosphatase type 2/haloperoxidase domain-containing protein n=1 Tax=Flaviaesturariibacter amylovorans TaxID=1084520 RepID=A0ABP8H0B1_9BACT
MKNSPLLLLLLLLAACSGNQRVTPPTASPLLYCATVKKLNDVVLYNNFPPMIAARNYAYAQIAAYECVAAGDARFRSLSGQIPHLPALPRPAAGPVDYPLAALLSFVKVGNSVTFPEGVLMDYYGELIDRARNDGLPQATIDRTVTWSDSVAAAVLRWSKKDNYAQTRTATRFHITSQEGRWTPTPPAYMQGLEPSWGAIRPLALDSAGQFAPPAPPPFNLKDTASEFYRQLREVRETVARLTPEQQHIAEFFDDNPFKLEVAGHVMYSKKKFSPAGHWMNIVGIAAEKAGADFSTTVAAYTATSIALFDGFIACWHSKYRYASIRPETVINKALDPEWRPYIQTPPFPSYISGHSVISAAAAETMTHFFGDRLRFTDTSLNEFGIKARTFASFRAAAQEASWSRLYGGIHFRSDLEEGNKVGTRIGAHLVQRLRFRKEEGK